jgi:sec-independent protein translocase protein TatA
MFQNFGAGEIILILFVVLLLFGAKRLPDTARGLGRALRIFKAETKGLHDDDDRVSRADDAARAQASPPPQPLPPAPPRNVADGQPRPAKDAERTER